MERWVRADLGSLTELNLRPQLTRTERLNYGDQIYRFSEGNYRELIDKPIADDAVSNKLVDHLIVNDTMIEMLKRRGVRVVRDIEQFNIDAGNTAYYDDHAGEFYTTKCVLQKLSPRFSFEVGRGAGEAPREIVTNYYNLL